MTNIVDTVGEGDAWRAALQHLYAPNRLQVMSLKCHFPPVMSRKMQHLFPPNRQQVMSLKLPPESSARTAPCHFSPYIYLPKA